jgi:hypothetical protein
MARPSTPRPRRPRGKLSVGMRGHLASKKGEPASISEIKAVTEPKAGIAPASCRRSALQTSGASSGCLRALSDSGWVRR